MKKLVSIVLALALVLLCVGAAFADDPVIARDATTETDGSVAVSNPTVGQKYTLYKIFDADMGANDAITYTLPSGKNSLGNGSAWFELNSNGFVVAKSGTADEWAKDEDAITWVHDFGTQVGEPITKTADNEVKWTGLAYGYYFVDTTLGAFVGVDSANKAASIREKNEPPTIDKEITGVDGSTATLGTGTDDDPGHGANEKAIAQVGDPITYKLTVNAKPGAQNYVVTDTLSAGLTPPAASGVSVSSGAGTYTVDVTNQVITVTFDQDYLNTLTAATTITIEYTAHLNPSAVIGEAGNPNTVRLTWGHDNTSNYDEDDAKVYTAKIDILKVDNSDPAKPLEGAGFVVKNADNKYYKLDDDNNVTWVESIDAADEHLSAADGKVPAFTGLKNGTYTLVEKTVPAGYNKLDDHTFTIADDDYTNTNLTQSETVVNNQGTTLPSTGGIGTTIFYILGGLLVIGAAVILVARRKAQD